MDNTLGMDIFFVLQVLVTFYKIQKKQKKIINEFNNIRWNLQYVFFKH